MKFNFSLEKREASFEADVEKLVEKHMDQAVQKPEKKSKYQIRQEEKRKLKEQEHRQKMKLVYLGLTLFVGLIALCIVMSFLEG